MKLRERDPRSRGSYARRARVAIVVAIAASCAAVAAAILFVPFLPFFCLYDLDDPSRVFIPGGQRFAASETEFVVSYTHSVNKGRVRDYYRFGADRVLRVEKTRFVSWGAGIPDPEGGNTFVNADGYIEIGNINRVIPRLVVRVGIVADHALELPGAAPVRLSDAFKPQTAVAFEYRNLSVFDYIRSIR